MFLQSLDQARSSSRWAGTRVWARAIVDIAHAIVHQAARRRRQRGRVGPPPHRQAVMISSDIRAAWRSLVRQPFATGLAIGMLALGIAASVAVFTLVNGIFLRPFPVPEPDRLVYINETAPKWNLEYVGIELSRLRSMAQGPATVRRHRAARHGDVQPGRRPLGRARARARKSPATSSTCCGCRRWSAALHGGRRPTRTARQL